MNSEHESQPRGYPWWQWVLGVLTFWPMIAMLVGTIKPSTRSDLTPKRIWLGYGLFCLVSFILLIALVAVIGTQDQVQTAPAVPRVNTQPNPAPAPRPEFQVRLPRTRVGIPERRRDGSEHGSPARIERDDAQGPGWSQLLQCGGRRKRVAEVRRVRTVEFGASTSPASTI